MENLELLAEAFVVRAGSDSVRLDLGGIGKGWAVDASLVDRKLALYDLIYRRTVASQMEDARGQTATIRLGATSSRGEGSGGASGAAA